MSTSTHLQRVHTSALNPLGGHEQSTAKTCLDLVDRAVSRMEEQAKAALAARLAMREAIRQSGGEIKRITQPSVYGRLGAGITKGLGRGRHLTEAAIAVVREYVASEGMKIEDAARRAQVSTESVKKYARPIREGAL